MANYTSGPADIPAAVNVDVTCLDEGNGQQKALLLAKWAAHQQLGHGRPLKALQLHVSALLFLQHICVRRADRCNLHGGSGAVRSAAHTISTINYSASSSAAQKI